MAKIVKRETCYGIGNESASSTNLYIDKNYSFKVPFGGSTNTTLV